jgi:hypothetical protein
MVNLISKVYVHPTFDERESVERTHVVMQISFLCSKIICLNYLEYYQQDINQHTSIIFLFSFSKLNAEIQSTFVHGESVDYIGTQLMVSYP